MNINNILSKVDHTLLSVDATLPQIKELCDDAIKYKVASVCIAPCFVKEVKEYVQNEIKICTVIGFPNGYNTSATKIFEASDSLENGAEEIDMVINIGALKNKDFSFVEREIKQIKEVCNHNILKVIIETCLLTETEKIEMCKIVESSGADFIKTSTGFSKNGATFDDVTLFKKHLSERVKIKAAGGIKTLEDAQTFINLGAERLGTSKIVKLIKKDGNLQ